MRGNGQAQLKTFKSEARNPKLETNSNVSNPKFKTILF